MKVKTSVKHVQINRAQSSMYAAVIISAAVIVFSLVGIKALLDQAGYHRRIINSRREAVKQLEANITAANTLSNQYQIFNNSGSANIIGGRSTKDTSAVPPDGDNARIVLNALPNTYDFPALISSLSKILQDNRMASPGISGSDQATSIDSSPKANPEPVTLPIIISGINNYGGVRNLIRDFERSTRPFDVTNIQISGSVNNMSVNVQMNTYFQPGIQWQVGSKEIK